MVFLFVCCVSRFRLPALAARARVGGVFVGASAIVFHFSTAFHAISHGMTITATDEIRFTQPEHRNYVARIVHLIWFDNVSSGSRRARCAISSLFAAIFGAAVGKQTVIASYIF